MKRVGAGSSLCSRIWGRYKVGQIRALWKEQLRCAQNCAEVSCGWWWVSTPGLVTTYVVDSCLYVASEGLSSPESL